MGYKRGFEKKKKCGGIGDESCSKAEIMIYLTTRPRINMRMSTDGDLEYFLNGE